MTLSSSRACDLKFHRKSRKLGMLPVVRALIRGKVTVGA
jgi:hypothetical protein